jgi:N-acetylglucosamine-6-sulfatase
MSMSVLQTLSRFVGGSGEERRFQSDVGPEGPDNGADRPNFVVVVTDDMRDSDWQALRKTQELINDQGTVFPNFFLTTAVCSPSRASILTGLYAHNHNVTRNSGRNGGMAQYKQRNLAEHSIPNALKQVGYRNGLFGKFMNGMSEKGGIPGAWDRWMASAELAYYSPLMNDNGKPRDFKKKRQYSTDILADRAVEFIRDTADETPLFLLFTPKAPHGPSIPARRHRGSFGGAQRERSPDVNEADVSDKPANVRVGKSVGLGKLDNLERKRLESLVSVDEAVERIVGTLDEEGRLDNTYIFVLSDNGYMMGSHRLEQKGLAYRESTQVRMAVRGPGFPTGVDLRVAANIDIAPTIVDLAGASLPNPDGISLAGAFDRDAVLLQGYGGNNAYQAARTDRHLYVEYSGGGRELYDYEVDPYELDNLLPQDEAAAGPLIARLNALRGCNGSGCS